MGSKISTLFPVANSHMSTVVLGPDENSPVLFLLKCGGPEHSESCFYC